MIGLPAVQVSGSSFIFSTFNVQVLLSPGTTNTKKFKFSRRSGLGSTFRGKFRNVAHFQFWSHLAFSGFLKQIFYVVDVDCCEALHFYSTRTARHRERHGRMQAASMPCSEGSCDAACGLWVSHVTYWRSVGQEVKRYPAAVRNGLEKTSATDPH